ncbi:MAG: TniQ family protein, partial [Candidatus Dormibacteraceae bacterium]
MNEADTPALEQYPEWELEPPTLPLRSQLYALEPIGVGTPLVECLTSYITRLAADHRLETGVLLRKILIPTLNKPSLWKNNRANMGSLLSEANALNGVGNQATEWVGLLERMTGREDLQALTLLRWANVLPAKDLLRQTRAWCLACYAVCREQHLVIYDPLLWTFRVVESCPLHKQRLHERCPAPACRRPIPWLERRARPGYCPYCYEWLGMPVPEPPGGEHLAVQEDEPWQVWVGQVVGALLAMNQALPVPPSRDQLTASLVSCIEQVTYGNQNAFAERLGLEQSRVRVWWHGQAIPLFPQLLRLCYQLDLAPLDLVTGRPFQVVRLKVERVVTPHAAVRRPRPRVDVRQLRQTLEGIIAAEEDPPPTLLEVSRRVGHDRRMLYTHVPDLCETIVARSTAYQKRRQQQKMEAVANEIRQVMVHLHSQGVYPAQTKVAKLLSKRGMFRIPAACDVWRQTLRELDLP